MQRIAGLLLMLWGLGWLASQMPSAADQPQPPTTSWRRTCVGWERVERLQNTPSTLPPAVHPAVFGLGLLLFALAGLIGFSPDQHPTPGEHTTPMPDLEISD